MALEEFTYTLVTSWSPRDSKDATNVITVGESGDPSQQSVEYEGEIEHAISDENLLFLMKPEEDVPCTLTVTIADPRWRITKLSVVLEMRIIELYGPHGEYICTCKGTNIGETDEISLYNTQPDLSVRHELTIKFPGATKSFWIYGVKLLVERTSTLQEGTFDYTHVDEMLKSSKLPLSDKAEQAKQFLQKYSGLLSGPRQPDPRAIFRILESEYKSHVKPVEDAGRNVSQYISSFLQASNKPLSQQQQQQQQGESEDNFDVKAYVDQSIKQLEERVQNNLRLQLEAMEEKQNQKLETILNLLQQRHQ